MNGSSIVAREDDVATDSADEFPSGAVSHSAATTTTSRSVSATLQHERRERSRVGARASPRTSAASDSRVGTHRNSHGHSNAPQQQQQQHGILNYIFGQNGPGPIGANSAVSAASVVSSAGSGSVTLQGGVGGADGVAASGRDVSGGADGVFRSGLLAGKHDGNHTAYDMKSLGKHIEAVRSFALTLLARWRIPTTVVIIYRLQRMGHS